MSVRKLALVTGSTSGIGLGIAHSLAKKGYNIMLNGFGDKHDIKSLCDRMAYEHSVDVHHSGADLSSTTEIEEMMRVCGDHGGVDVLVNNAGIQHVAPVDSFPTPMWDKVIAINLSAVFHTTRLAIPVMRERNWGRVVNIASAHGLVASPNKSPYVASKHGVVGFTKSVALELAHTGVTANSICPGWVKTPLVEQQIQHQAERLGITVEESTHQLLEEKQPSLQFATTTQIGEITVFLCSDSANEVRGAAWSVDGGWTAR